MRQAASWRRICRCFRAASNFRSRPAWISCCRPANVCFGVMWPVVAVQADVVVVVHVSAYQTPCVIERQRRSWPDALPF